MKALFISIGVKILNAVRHLFSRHRRTTTVVTTDDTMVVDVKVNVTNTDLSFLAGKSITMNIPLGEQLLAMRTKLETFKNSFPPPAPGSIRYNSPVNLDCS